MFKASRWEIIQKKKRLGTSLSKRLHIKNRVLINKNFLYINKILQNQIQSYYKHIRILNSIVSITTSSSYRFHNHHQSNIPVSQNTPRSQFDQKILQSHIQTRHKYQKPKLPKIIIEFHYSSTTTFYFYFHSLVHQTDIPLP